jgi:citryl-CoA lyase
MQWKTALTQITEGGERIRGKKLTALIQQKSFVEVIALLWTGLLPNAKQTKMLNALFVAAIDHGVGAPSATVARTVVSTGNSLHTAVSAGVQALGELHGGAIEGAGHFFEAYIHERDLAGLAKRLKDAKVRVPGYGHKVLAVDERAKILLAMAKKTGFYKQHCALAVAFGKELQALASKPLPLNIDGAMAAIILDMGYPAELAKGFFLVGRLPGLVAHAHEQATSGEGLKRLDESEIEYTGK